MPSKTEPTDRPDAFLLAEVAEALDRTSNSHKAGASRAACAAAVLRGDAGPVGGEAARARLAHLALRMLAAPEVFRADGVARFLWQQHGHLPEAPIDLVRTVAGAEQVRRLVEQEPPLGRPDPARVAAAAQLDDLTVEEAFAAYAAGHIGSPRVMAITGLRSLYGIMTALTQRDLRLPVRPSQVGPGRDDRDLLWEHMSNRGDAALQARDAEYRCRPTPPPEPERDAAWPLEVPGDASSLSALDSVAAALDAEFTQQLAQADRASMAAAGLRGDAAAVGGEDALERLAAWSLLMMRRTEEEHRADWTAVFLLQPLPEVDGSYPFEELGDGALELARTAEGAARVERWLAPDECTSMITASGTTLCPGPAVEEAFVAYATGRIDSQRLMDVTGLDGFFEVWGQLQMRGLQLPLVPTPVDMGRDDRDLLWESLASMRKNPPDAADRLER